MTKHRISAQNSLLPRLAATAVFALALTSCAPGGNTENPGNTSPPTNDSVTSQAPVPQETENGGSGNGLPASFPSEVPLLSYEITSIRVREEAREYRVQMNGTDAQQDAETARAQFADAGFTESNWQTIEGRYIGGTFEKEPWIVNLSVREKDGAVEIEYNVGTHEVDQ